MKDEFTGGPFYFPPEAWPYLLPDPMRGLPAPQGNAWPAGGGATRAGSNGGLLGNFAPSPSGVLGNLSGPAANPAGLPRTGPPLAAQAPAATPPLFLLPPSERDQSQNRSTSSVAAYDRGGIPVAAPANGRDPLNSAASNSMASRSPPEPPPGKPIVPLSGPNGVWLPPPEPAPPQPPRDFPTWLNDTLSDDNVRYVAGPHLYESLRKLQTLMQLFLPGSGTAQSREESAEATKEVRAGNYGKAAAHIGMGTLNAALDWLPPAKLAILAGVMAKTFPRNKLPTALEMEAAGKPADEIWRATGLERDAARNWTHEISDKGYYVHPNPENSKARTVPLYHQYVHPGMQEAYPGLSNWRSKLIINPYEDREGRVKLMEKLLELQVRGMQGARNAGIHELKHLIDILEGHPPGSSPQYFIDRGFSEREAVDHYLRSIGEVAARNSQYRLRHLSDEKRRLLPPQATEDVPRNRQINLFDDEWQ
jgi:hypothetical protein